MGLLQAAIGVVVGKTPGAMVEGQGTVGVFTHLYRDLDEVMTEALGAGSYRSG